MATDWQQKASAKRQAILDSIPSEWRLDSVPTTEAQKDVTGVYIQQFLSSTEKEITETDTVEIASRIASREWSAVDVTRAFCHRAAIAHQLLNCLHETFFGAALEDAKALDEYLSNEGKVKGPLHGVPVSLKDQFHVKGVDTSMGYVGWIGNFQGQPNDPRHRTYESEMVRELRECGAVLYCKTSVPHTLMCGETANNIIDYTWNPKNRYLSSGGSSGGEGALIGIRGSTVGLGSDIGGSIRIPSAFNGLYGLRPSAGRLSYYGMANSMDGQNGILSVVGPLSTSAGGLKLVTKSLLSTKPWVHDPRVIPLPWRTEEEDFIYDMIRQASSAPSSNKKLSFGVLRHDGQVHPHPPVSRAIDTVVEALRSAGHEVVEWTQDQSSLRSTNDSTSATSAPTTTAGSAIASDVFCADGGADLTASFALSGEPSNPEITFYQDMLAAPERTATSISTLNISRRTYQKQFLDYWNTVTPTLTTTRRPIDGLISPVAPFAAPRRARYRHYGYTTWVNTLDFTTVVVPVTTCDAGLDTGYPKDWTSNGDLDDQVRADYDPELYHGAHVSVQIVGRPFEEEKMIAIAGYVGELLGA